MERKKRVVFAKFALTAMILSVNLPAAGYASGEKVSTSYSVSNEEAIQNNQSDEGLLTLEDSSPSSYQGTTTGPGPNGGYPGSPRGTYNVVNPPKQTGR